MTPLPKRRTSTRRQGKRRSSIKYTLPNLSLCPNCHQFKELHTVCSHCGFYKGKEITKIKTKKVNKKVENTV